MPKTNWIEVQMKSAELSSLEQLRDAVENRITTIRNYLAREATTLKASEFGSMTSESEEGVSSSPARRPKTMSPAARQRISSAQKKRWDRQRKESAAKTSAAIKASKKSKGRSVSADALSDLTA